MKVIALGLFLWTALCPSWMVMKHQMKLGTTAER